MDFYTRNTEVTARLAERAVKSSSAACMAELEGENAELRREVEELRAREEEHAKRGNTLEEQVLDEPLSLALLRGGGVAARLSARWLDGVTTLFFEMTKMRQGQTLRKLFMDAGELLLLADEAKSVADILDVHEQARGSSRDLRVAPCDPHVTPYGRRGSSRDSSTSRPPSSTS
eukprot:518368-Prymnesium_polylepis.1